VVHDGTARCKPLVTVSCIYCIYGIDFAWQELACWDRRQCFIPQYTRRIYAATLEPPSKCGTVLQAVYEEQAKSEMWHTGIVKAEGSLPPLK